MEKLSTSGTESERSRPLSDICQEVPRTSAKALDGYAA